ncbi:ribonuclease VapC [Rhizomicrobium palustre]|uniref:Ribonuclease VapC n=1 Tax=Rhizomicrobium palustre TaxID=189966 RepID=A0A846MYC7_9PROT|nr:type II toxin-antitoxin system VapC family toxin [Rhizomicrobium palustre]NIK88239.1 ribonuclease VapC [Rhizomicrobium palustre]
MVVDSSAIFAILLNEPERSLFLDAILSAKSASLSAVTLLECRIVALRRTGRDWDTELSGLLQRLPLTIIPFDDKQSVLAAEAFRAFGKSRHKAALNFGDCISYALAKSRGEPLLYKGTDFAETDIASALA